MKRLGLVRAAFFFALMTVPVLLFVASAFAAGPSGAGPADPLMVPVSSQAIAPNTTLWFYFDYGLDSGGGFGRRRAAGKPPAAVAVDAAGASGLGFAIYTPDQAKSWVADPSTAPVGRGTIKISNGNGSVIHDLYWAGGFNTSGRYLIAVTNSNAAQVTFTMSVEGDDVTLYPTVALSPTPTLFNPFTVTPVPTATVPGKILFETTTGGEIWTVNGDGSNLTRVSRGIDPAWSPDGKQITFARWDNTNPGIFAANADGSNERLVFATPKARWPRWSPDGKSILFSQDKSKSDRELIWKLGVVEVATGRLTEPQCSQLCYVPTWGKDSATIVYDDPNIGVMKTNALQGPPALLGPTGRWWDSAANISRPIVNWPDIQDTSLSPDGNRIAFSMQAHDRWELNVMTSDGGSMTGLTNPDPILNILMDVVDHNVAPVWSPDSKQIMFMSDRNGKWEFFVLDPDSGNMQQVLKNVTDLVPVKYTYENERIMDWTK